MSALVEQLRAHAREHPQRTALIVPHVGKPAESVSYETLSQSVDRWAGRISLHMGGPAIVPIIAGKSAEMVAAMFGILAAGGAFAAINRKLKPPQFNQIYQQTKSHIGLIDAAQMPAILKDAAPDDPIRQIEWLTLNDHAENQTGSFPVVARTSESAGCCLFTSGSTGRPKGVLISEADLFARAVAETNLYQLTGNDALLCVLPFSFDVGLNQLLSAIVAGCAIVLAESWLPADIVRAAAQFHVTGISAVPAIWNDLLNANMQFDTRDAHRSLRYVTVSGGDLPAEKLRQLSSAIGDAGIFKTYGQSETFRSAALRPDEFNKRIGSVGKPFASARAYILRPDGTQAAANEPGEIVHSGLGTMLGYLDSDGASPNLRANPFFGSSDSSRLAVFTGDIGWLDEDGFLFVQGRSDAMLKVAGNRVYPKEVADQIAALPGVGEVEVIGQKDDRGETQILAFIVARGGETISDLELRRQLLKLLPSYMMPRQLFVLPRMPRTASGKPDRLALLERLNSAASVANPH